MKRHLKGSSEELWPIIQDGFHPYDRHNMTPREYRDNSINSHALVVIGNGLKPEQENLVRKCETAKECWDLLERTLMGSASIRSSKLTRSKTKPITSSEMKESQPRMFIKDWFLFPMI